MARRHSRLVGMTMDRKAARRRNAELLGADPLAALKERAQQEGRALTAEEGAAMLDPLLSCLTPEELRRATQKPR